MMGTRERLINGDEYDAFSQRWRYWRGGICRIDRKVKARFWRRVRKQHKLRTVLAAV